MRRSFVLSLLLFIALFPAAEKCLAGVDFGLSIGSEGVKSFYLAIGDHYQVPEKQIMVVRERKISDEEMPVVFYLAARAKVGPETIIKLRLGGKSWMDISAKYGFGPEIYYVALKSDPGPPYGKAYGHFKNRKRKEWGSIKLTDADVVNFVNLRFISEHYGCSPDEIIKMRAKGKDFVSVNAEVKKNKGQSKKEYAKDSKKSGKGNSKGKGKNK